MYWRQKRFEMLRMLPENFFFISHKAQPHQKQRHFRNKRTKANIATTLQGFDSLTPSLPTYIQFYLFLSLFDGIKSSDKCFNFFHNRADPPAQSRVDFKRHYRQGNSGLFLSPVDCCALFSDSHRARLET